MQTIQKQFVPYEIALAMKELGFNEECLACYTPHLGKGIFELISKGTSNEKSGFNEKFIKAEAINGCATPLWQQCVDWFREQFNLMINSPVPDEWNTGKWSVKLESLDKKMILEEHVGQPYWRIYRGFDSYEKAKEQAILKCIELCKKQKEI